MYVLSVCLFMVFSPFTLGVNYFQCQTCCTFDGPGWEHMEYTITQFYNKKLGMLYNSTTGSYTGFTENGIHVAQLFKNDPYGPIRRKFEKDFMCKERLFAVKDVGVNYFQTHACCTFDGPGLKHMEYTITQFYNKKLGMLYNSTTGNYTGFTENGIHVAQLYKNEPYGQIKRKIQKDLMCKDRLYAVKDLGNLTVAPTVKVTQVMHPSVLLCSAYDFYPKQIRVTWLQNGQEVISSTEAIPDGDWYYQIHSYLEYTPTPGETISCVVEHTSLHEPLIQVWDSSLPKSQRIIDGVGTFFLVVGLVCMSVGFIYYKRKSAAPLTLCRGREMVPVEVVPVAGAL
ncbi:rano class II histocompatibility antigen, A beta chain-like isoform X1 [Sphaeramia orbicularis]|uniref:rano class II histocompatibility antigen, A beta chain-like isoform X1 n=1 Tax=Sphaeramia orbicularis TaxID=375764 RepID=UPI00117F6E82|nr:rano class II histocompatibility antigen, A beta chain-like isoform X1 [Sphaeramia orbicularis]